MSAQLNVTFAGSVVVPWAAGYKATTALLLGADHCPSLAVDVASLVGIEPVMKPSAHFVDGNGRQIAIFDLTGQKVDVDGGSGPLVVSDAQNEVLHLEWMAASLGVPGDPATDTYSGVSAKVTLGQGSLTPVPPLTDSLIFTFPFHAAPQRIASLLRWTVTDHQLPAIVLTSGSGKTTFRFKAGLTSADVSISALCGAITEQKTIDVEPWDRLFGAKIPSPAGTGGAAIVKTVYTCPPLMAPPS